MFSGEIEFERFYLYSRYASQNKFMHLVDVFMDKMIEILEDENQDDNTDWFAGAMTKEEGCWMLTLAGPGNLTAMNADQTWPAPWLFK